MPINRHTVLPTILSRLGAPADEAMEGMVVHFKDFPVTASSDTTSVMYLGGLLPWRIVNESGGALTFTFYDALAQDGTALTAADCDEVDVPALTVADDESVELPPGLSGITWLIVKAGGAGSHITVICRR